MSYRAIAVHFLSFLLSFLLIFGYVKYTQRLNSASTASANNQALLAIQKANEESIRRAIQSGVAQAVRDYVRTAEFKAFVAEELIALQSDNEGCNSKNFLGGNSTKVATGFVNTNKTQLANFVSSKGAKDILVGSAVSNADDSKVSTAKVDTVATEVTSDLSDIAPKDKKDADLIDSKVYQSKLIVKQDEPNKKQKKRSSLEKSVTDTSPSREQDNPGGHRSANNNANLVESVRQISSSDSTLSKLADGQGSNDKDKSLDPLNIENVAFADKHKYNDGRPTELNRKTTSSNMKKSSRPNKLQLVFFFDYNCPFCKDMHETVFQFSLQHPEIDVLYREIPAIGRRSLLITRYAIAVKLLYPAHYYRMQSALLNLGGVASTEDVFHVFRRIGIDPLKIQAFLDSAGDAKAVNQVLEQHIKHANILDIRGTPSIAINNNILSGKRTLADLENILLAIKAHEPHFKAQQGTSAVKPSSANYRAESDRTTIVNKAVKPSETDAVAVHGITGDRRAINRDGSKDGGKDDGKDGNLSKVDINNVNDASNTHTNTSNVNTTNTSDTIKANNIKANMNDANAWNTSAELAHQGNSRSDGDDISSVETVKTRELLNDAIMILAPARDGGNKHRTPSRGSSKNLDILSDPSSIPAIKGRSNKEIG